MTLEPGARFGSFEIVAPLGAGAMGEVWRARDPRLGRDVALKLVGEPFAADPERMARFDREAKLLAGFNHPHIAVLYGQEDSGGRRALVMELVEGESLAERVAAGPIPLREALSLARQIAEALSHAHAQGIVHRDLKPANVKVTPDGAVKVLDFGLGKPLAAEGQSDPLSSPTLTRPGTAAGVLLGTAAYMSPEQARGHAADRRSDVWAFGVTLFEMLTGTRLFRGATTSDVLAAVLRSDVEWERLPPATPEAARRLLRRCLERDARERLHDFADVRIEIAEALRELDRPPGGAAAREKAWRAALPWGIALLSLVSAVVVVLARRPPAVPSRVSHLRLSLQPKPLVMAGSALSPDGRLFAYVANGQIHVRPLDRDEARSLPEARGSRPFFSPDGSWIGFVGPDDVPMKIAVSGGPPVALTDSPRRIDRCVWSADGTVLCTQASSQRPGELLRIPAGGGAPEPVPTTADGVRQRVGWPQVLPGGRSVLVTIASPAGGPQDESSIVAQWLDTGQRTVVVRGASQATYSPTGHLVFARGNALFAVSFDPETLQVRGTPFPVAEHVSRDTVRGGRYAFAADGTLVFFRETDDDRPLLWVDRQGRAVRIPAPPHTFLDPRLSPDRTRIAVQAADGDNDIWVCDLVRGSLTRLTIDPGEDETPVWSPDGAWVAWATQRSGRPRQIMRRRADGSGVEQPIWTTEKHAHVYDWSPDGKELLVTQDGEATARDVWIVPVAGGGARPLLQGPFEERNPRLSPDGRWLAYSSDESGRFEVYVVRFPGMEGRAQVSVGGGDCAAWGARGSEIVYRSAGGEVASVRFSPAPAGPPRVGRPVELFPDTYGVAAGRTSHVDYDVDPDGNRFVVVGRQLGEGVVELGVVLNWFDELKRLASQSR